MRPILLAALAALALPAAARGQVEITALGGFRFGGDVDTTVPGTAGSNARYEVADSSSFGIHVGYAVGDGEIELSYARQNSKLQTSDLFTGVPVFDLALETWQLGGNVVFGEPNDRLQPCVGLAAGLTRLLPGPAALSDETRFAGSCVGGAKLWLARSLTSPSRNDRSSSSLNLSSSRRFSHTTLLTATSRWTKAKTRALSIRTAGFFSVIARSDRPH